ncbi:Sialic acid TRAP transporter permease protein SiaT [Pseudovibrio axinellae]|uniref:TRAP transporter large permease protein n=1 Tax=Pseudovibrio axinellae TaxID=989403 RepID=A0A165UMH5_9HYPH|nr:TRAP transporter large permease [Pseudovibrio axinellae]KZL12559.1 Sialic acid TRAP transporter permease protein SiaT [Pseudovibrio axinellae]SEP66917.1 C4-dicarboxylate transporter, DctM subunit [Pseudovibrio axinellae]
MTGAVLLTLAILVMLVLRLNLIVILMVLGGAVQLMYSDGELVFMAEDFWAALDREVLLSIPVFLLCGCIMSRGAIAERLVRVLKELTGSIAGGFGVAAVLSCAFFAAFSGSSIVTLLAVGSVLYPALREQGYATSYSLGALTSAGTLGVIIPPSIPMIIYGLVTDTSITDMFLAAVIPGLLLTFLLTAYAAWSNRNLPSEPFDFVATRKAISKGSWSLMMPVILLGGIFSGYFTATESAAVALCYALIVECCIYRELSLSQLFQAVVHTSQLLGGLLPILAIAATLNMVMTTEQVPSYFADWISSQVEQKWMFLLTLNLLLLLVGFFMGIISALLIMAPLLLPVASAYGIDPVHMGVIMVINLEIGLLTPPVGINLLVASQTFKESFWTVARSVIPFVLLMLLVLLLVTFVPNISIFFLG